MSATEHIGPLFKMIACSLEQKMNDSAAGIGLTSAQLHILHYLCVNAEQDIYQRDIEARFHLSHATVSGIISRLEAKEFIRYLPAEGDRRCKRIEVTAKALESDGEMRKNITENEKQLLCGFSQQETAALRKNLEKILANLDVDLPKHEFEEVRK